MPQTTYVEAIRQGIWEEMERDSTVFVMGEDVAVYGGAFKVTKGMLDRFGEMRVVDTPLAESGIVGAGTGAAINGLRPILEMQFADFMGCGFDQITNFAAKCRYRWGQSIPMVIRAPAGGNIHGGPFHSQNVEMPYVHTPGLKVVQPATAYDAKGLIKAAIRDNDPVIFLEHKYLYRSVKEHLPTSPYTVPIGKAKVHREGSDISIITYGWMVHVADEAAGRAAAEGISVEVLDLRTLVPLDRGAVLATAKKTSKIILLHEDTLTGGLGGELAGIIGEHAFDYLDGPLVRIAAPDTPVPFSETLEKAFLPSSDQVLEKTRWLYRY
ncbi:MAG: alpha-ketoacid dehydrogenase subunit beta [Bryobacterales bacterium]|nr:alpha-ketoacid dehydrogenase subunit beta [Bryobacterales bacterium]